MATIGDLVVNLNANTRGYSSGLQQAQRETASFAARVKTTMGSIGGKVVRGGLMAAGAGIAAVASRGAMLAASMEQSEVALRGLTGSGEDAAKVMKQLQQFAASTPFQLEGLTDAAQGLITMGSSTENVIPELKMIGDIAAGTGKPLQDLVNIYGKVRKTGKLGNEQITQLAERGVDMYGLLRDQLGDAEADIFKLASEGKFGFENLAQAFVDLTKDGAQFHNMMDEQSKTLSGLWSTLIDNIDQGLGEIFGKMDSTFDFRNILRKLIEFVQKARALWRWLGESAIAVGDWIGTNWTNFPKAIVTAFEKTGQAVVQIGKWIGDNWQTIFDNMLTKASSIVRNIIDATKALGRGEFSNAIDELVKEGPAGKALTKLELPDFSAKALGLTDLDLPEFADILADIQGGIDAGGPLDPSKLGGTKASAKSSAKANQKNFAGAMTRGSAEAFSAIVNAMQGGSSVPAMQLKVQQQMAKDAQATAKELAEANDNLNEIAANGVQVGLIAQFT